MNDNPAPAPTEEEIEEARKKNEVLRHRVAMIMDELRSIFIPEMKLTFVARHPGQPDLYTLLTEETDMAAFSKWLETTDRPTTLERGEISNAVN